MQHGFELFGRYLFDQFADYIDNYVIIGGTACEVVLRDTDMRARATDDFDMILVVENMTPEFGAAFWAFIKDGGYTPRKRNVCQISWDICLQMNT